MYLQFIFARFLYVYVFSKCSRARYLKKSHNVYVCTFLFVTGPIRVLCYIFVKFSLLFQMPNVTYAPCEQWIINSGLLYPVYDLL